MPTAAAVPTPPARADVIDGKAFAARIHARVAAHVATLAPEGLVPGLAVVVVGDNPASAVYVRTKARLSREAGMRSFDHRLPRDTSGAALLALIAALNDDPAVHGILVQLPLPDHIDERAALSAVAPEKDVDGFHPINVGRVATGQKAMVPCTPLGCLLMLKERHGSLAGLDAVVVGRSNIVGKPMAQLLLAADATVTIAHSRTTNLPDVCRRADIVVAAVGRPQMILGSWLKPGATVIDVGINTVPAPERGEGGTRLVGDVDFASAVEVAGAITPVPGGVGPMTVACLLANTLTAACRSAGLPVPAGLSL